METAFSSGPGFYAARSNRSNRRVPKGRLRMYLCRLEAYDSDESNQDDVECIYEILFNKANGNPEIALALIDLGEAINKNMEFLKAESVK